MTFLPIVVRELRVAARRKSTYSARFKSALVAVVGGAGMMFVVNQIPFDPNIGLAVFLGLAVVGFLYCLGLAMNTADCISEEKREGTLGLLFLTDLSGWDVALGKLCANSLKSFYAVIATFPVVAIVLTLGGVSAGQFCKVALALLNVFFFAHAAGLLASVMCRARHWGYVATGAIFLGSLFGPSLLALPFGGGRFAALALLLEALSPGYAFDQALLPTGSRFYWISLLMVHLTGWLLLALASWRLPHCWQEKAGPTRLRWRDRFRQWTYGRPAFREELRRELAGVNPFLWLVSRNRLNLALNMGVYLLGGCFAIWAWFASDPDERNGLLVAIVIIGHVSLICGVAAEASRHFEEHRRSGALEFILCSTPLQPGEILAGQWMALRRLFLRPLILLVAYDAVMALLDHTGYVDADPQVKAQFDWFMAVAIVMVVVDVAAAGWIGMWRAMANRKAKQNIAIAETVVVLLIVPFILLALIGGLLSLLAALSPKFERWFGELEPSFGFVLGLWFVLALAIAVGLSFWARRQLLTQFREMAAVQWGEPLGIFGQLGRLLGKAFRRR